jgi:hypothetical protein
LALAQMLMASLVGNAARHAFLSIEGWAPVLARVAPRLTSTSWSPVPSNMPTDVDVRDAFALREQLAGGASVLVGHFSTHTPETATFLASVARLLRPSGGRVVVMGRGWDTDATGPHFVSKGRLPVDDVARHLAACDVIVQPYPLDGVSARRTTVMSSLALGAPIVTNEGRLSESIWRKSSAVHLVKATPEDFAAGVLALASDAELRAGLSARARTLYRSYFDIARTVDALLGPRSQGEPCASWSPAAPASSAHTSARGSSGTETR